MAKTNPLEDKLVIAVSSSALFNTADSHNIYLKSSSNIEEYIGYQKDHRNDHYQKGAIYTFISRLLRLNSKDLSFAPVEVVLLSRNDPASGLRVFNSIEHYKLGITRATFNQGRSPFKYNKSFGAVLYLSTNEQDVRNAVNNGIPGGYVNETCHLPDDDDPELRIAFDFDGILGGSDTDKIYIEEGIDGARRFEEINKNMPLTKGPLQNLLKKISSIKTEIRKIRVINKDYQHNIRTAIITARSAPLHKRVITTLEEWGTDVDELFLLGGIDKSKIIREFKPHIFFDDTKEWIDLARDWTAAVHVPFGVLNQQEIAPPRKSHAPEPLDDSIKQPA